MEVQVDTENSHSDLTYVFLEEAVRNARSQQVTLAVSKSYNLEFYVVVLKELEALDLNIN